MKSILNYNLLWALALVLIIPACNKTSDDEVPPGAEAFEDVIETGGTFTEPNQSTEVLNTSTTQEEFF